jgi:hypothetical protein
VFRSFRFLVAKGYAGLFCVLGTVRDAHEADSLSARSHLSHTTQDRSLRNYKNNNKVNYDLLEVDEKPRLKRVN